MALCLWSERSHDVEALTVMEAINVPPPTGVWWKSGGQAIFIALSEGVHCVEG